MNHDPRVPGPAPYPTTGPLAVLVRVAFLGALMAIVVAVFLPREFLPQFVRSHHLQHFAAFYVAGLLGLAASPRTRPTTVAVRLVLFITAIEASHLVAGARLAPLIDNWVADLGGLGAAFAPLAVARFRRGFERSPRP